MKHLLIRLSAGLLLALTITANLPAVSQPTTSPSATSQSSNPVMKGVTLTPEQQKKLISIRKETDTQISQMLTPEQKKLVATKGPKAVQLTKAQQERYVAILRSSEAKAEAVFTPAQIQQIKANLQALRDASGKK